MKHILLCHSGETDALAAIPALADRYDAGVVTVTVDVGQDGTSAGWRERALSAGAIRAHVLDARDEFARDYVLRALHACALREDAAAQGAALHRALLADKIARVAGMEGASIVAHSLEPHSDEAVELERLVVERRPDFVVVAARSLSSTTPTHCQNVLSIESTLWWRRALLDVSDPALVPRHIPGVRQGLFTVTPIEWCPPGAASVEIVFKEGVPIGINGVEMPLVELIEAVDTIAGDHGVGRRITAVDISGIQRTAVTEAPASNVLASAYVTLARAIESRSLWRVHRQLGRQYADMLDAGDWHSDMRRAIDAFVADTRQRISGSIRLALRRGRCAVIKNSVTPENASTIHDTPRPAVDRSVGINAPLPH